MIALDELAARIGEDLQRILSKHVALRSLDHPVTDAAKEALLLVRQLDFDCHIFTQQLLERYLALVFSQDLELKSEQLADSLLAADAYEKKLVFVKRSPDCKWPSILCVAHKFTEKANAAGSQTAPARLISKMPPRTGANKQISYASDSQMTQICTDGMVVKSNSLTGALLSRRILSRGSYSDVRPPDEPRC